MSEILIKGVGKKVNINNSSITISKTIGKDLEIPLENIKDISYEKGTMSKNGSIHIEWNNSNGEKLNEDIMFRCFSNDIVEESVNGILNYLKNSNESLMINEKEKIGVFQQLNRESKEQIENKNKESLREKEKLENLKKQSIPYCPKCHSTSVTTTNKKLSVGRAAVGGVLLGGTGAILGGLTSKKVELLCMNCGHKFKPGER